MLDNKEEGHVDEKKECIKKKKIALKLTRKGRARKGDVRLNVTCTVCYPGRVAKERERCWYLRTRRTRVDMCQIPAKRQRK